MADRQYADVETSSDQYAKRFSGRVGEWFLQRQAKCTGSLLHDMASGVRVLEVGGGHAQLVPLLLGRGFDVTVIGSAPDCAHRLRSWLDAQALRFETGDLLALPFPDKAFDLVLSFRLLPHIAEWDRLVGELCRVSSRSVIVDYPSTRSVNVWADRFFGAKKRIEGDTREFAVFAPTQVAAAFAVHGFDVVAERGQFLWPMALHRAAGSAPLSRLIEAIPRAAGLTRAFGSPRILRADRRGRSG